MTTFAPIIRRATPDDASSICALAIQTMWEAFGPPHNRAEDVEAYVQETFTVDKTREELTDPKATFLLVPGSDGKAIGYAKIRRQRPPRQLRGQHAIEIQRLYVANDQIGSGLGRKLLEACQDIAQEEGYTAVWLGVWEHNQRAIRFYERMGFQCIGWHYFQFGQDRQRDYWMSKTLRQQGE
ncbi:GNAT family N-acetyltransferase [Tellurirhabdus bombi]|uniref:GNAT family N-acetyltransferase n=1 Tax=Tellurirhabdus bombi TaxID=2907205 RepID=UPI001F2B2CD0|nr:GNAT family N-acetyltransferase [Tellurirhabdus bombi]